MRINIPKKRVAGPTFASAKQPITTMDSTPYLVENLSAAVTKAVGIRRTGHTFNTIKVDTDVARTLPIPVPSYRPKHGAVQRQPTSVAPAPVVGEEPIRTKPLAINIPLDLDKTIMFKSATATIDGATVYVTGRLSISGRASLVGESLPKKQAATALRNRVRELVTTAFSTAKPVGTLQKIEVPLGNEMITLQLAPGAETLPAFQVSGSFTAPKRALNVPGTEIERTTLKLNATVWISPHPAPQSGSQQGSTTSSTPGDAQVTRFAFAGQEVQFSGKARTGNVALKSAMDEFEQKVPDFVKQHRFLRLPDQRAAFFQHMRAYFGTDEKTIAHFAKLRKANVKGAQTWLHDEAAKRLEAVQAEIGEANMPASGGVGWPRSEASFASTQTIGNLHNIGFAVDYNAYQTPHLKDRKILDLIQIVTGRSASATYGAPNGVDTRAVGETFTTGSAEAKQQLGADPKIQVWLEQIGREAEAVSKASEDFRSSLKSTDAAGTEVDLAPKVQELRQQWFAAKTDAERQTILSQLPTVLKPWLDKIAAQKSAMETKIKAAGLEPSLLPTADALTGAVKSASRLIQQIDALQKQIKTRLSKRQRNQVDKNIDRARTLLGEKSTPLTDDAAAMAELQRLLGLLEQREHALVQKQWLDRVNALHTALTTDPTFIFGKNSDKVVSNPALTQLVDLGFFTLQGKAKAGKEAFNVDFVKSMVKHGFTHGATWGTPDLMHFELRWQGPGQ